MSERNRCWRRKKNFSKANRKKNIAIDVCRDWWYEHDGQYIKGKIHCSCPSCSAKTNNRGRYGKSLNYTHADRIKAESDNYKVLEYQNEVAANI